MNGRLPVSELPCFCVKAMYPVRDSRNGSTFNIIATSLHWYGSPHAGGSCGVTLFISSKRSAEHQTKRRMLLVTAPATHETRSPHMKKQIQKSEGTQGVS